MGVSTSSNSAVTYVPLQTQTASGSAATVSFNSIPSTYTDLVVIVNGSIASGGTDLTWQFNGDTASNYSQTAMYGNGTTATSDRGSNSTSARAGRISTANSTSVVNIMNYANTTTYKTIIGRGNAPDSLVIAQVGLWRATPAAINSITIGNAVASNFTNTTTFTLYGILAA